MEYIKFKYGMSEAGAVKSEGCVKGKIEDESEAVCGGCCESASGGSLFVKGDAVTRVLCGIFAVILFFVGIYLSEIEVPGCVERMCLGYVRGVEGACEEVNIEENSGYFGEKKLVSAVEGRENEVGIGSGILSESSVEENLNFAKSVAIQGAEAEEAEKSESEGGQKFADDAVMVLAKDMSKGGGGIYFTNRTELELSAEKYLEREYPIEKIGKSEQRPKVLILHTHGTESYFDTSTDSNFRSKDVNKNVVRVGEELKKALEAYGIAVIHSKTMHDEVSYVKSYENSKKQAQEYIERYPSIEYVIDLHRDALGTESQPIKPYSEINGEETAQLMLVMGSNAAGGYHPNFEDNLTVAVHIQRNLNELFPSLMRPINIRPIIFNQNLAKGCMLLEVGSCANTLDEALCSVRMFARGFAQAVLQ